MMYWTMDIAAESVDEVPKSNTSKDVVLTCPNHRSKLGQTFLGKGVVCSVYVQAFLNCLLIG